MSRLSVAPIVEGHGEQAAVRTLLQRLWYELIEGQFIEVLRPIRQPRTKLIQPGGLERAVTLAGLKLADSTANADHRLVLVLIDANATCPARLGPELSVRARAVHTPSEVAIVIAKVEFETWFIAAAESLATFLNLDGTTIPDDPEAARSGKRWVEQRFRGSKYSETVDQVRLTAHMDLALCRGRSPSFDKLCRELTHRSA